MKKILFAVLLTSGFALGANAQDKVQEKDVPTAVQTSFKAAFPNAKDIEWKLKEGKYKVDFEINGNDNIASFGANGKMIARGMKIRTSELPNAVSAAVKSAYADKTIDDVYRIDKDGTALYLVKLDGDPDTKILYTADGKEVKEKLD